MPVEQLPDLNVSYHLIAYDADGVERTDDPHGDLGQRTVDVVASGAVTDLFLFSHGWLGDVPSARRQYGGWLTAAFAAASSLARLQARPGGFRPGLVGLHWPSLPWGDEELEAPESFAPGAAPDEALVAQYAARLADTPAARQALHTIFAAARRAAAPPPRLPAEVEQAYATLNAETGMGAAGVGAAPGSDREAFDPQAIYAAALEEGPAAFGLFDGARDWVLAPLRQLSFWKMKDRGRLVGEAGVHPLLARLQQAGPARLHLMGHSFGCIVVSAAVAGPPGGAGLPRPVSSLVLVQGAMSLWSYCDDIPSLSGTPGYFRRLAEGAVAGPIVTTRSRFDTAVGRWYPLAARAAGQVEFAPGEFPKYGGIGSFGLQGTV